jgi:hypothetical protein
MEVFYDIFNLYKGIYAISRLELKKASARGESLGIVRAEDIEKC